MISEMRLKWLGHAVLLIATGTISEESYEVDISRKEKERKTKTEIASSDIKEGLRWEKAAEAAHDRRLGYDASFRTDWPRVRGGRR